MTIKLPIKIVIPYPSKFEKYGISLPEQYRQMNVFSWYDWKFENNSYVVINDDERDDIVKNMVLKEIKFLESSERIIFSGFSQGGKYLLHILNQMKIKTLFNVIFKSVCYPFEGNKHKNENSEFNSNIFYCYYSRNEKVINFSMAVKSIQILKANFDNVHIKIDNSAKHVVDYNCLAYLDKIIVKHLYKYRITKF